MRVSGRGRLWGKAPKGGYHVRADKNGVWFAIGNQGFQLHVPEDEPTARAKLESNRWFAKMLRKALKRLKSGDA